MASTQPAPLPWKYSFNVPGTLEETGSMDSSSSPYFWLNSGGRMLLTDGCGHTIEGDLPSNDKAYQLYKNDEGADFGAHPQNLFRLFTRNKYPSLEQSVKVKMLRYIVSPSTQREASDGFVLGFSDITGQFVYYFALRVDGYLVIKQKDGSVNDYSTLAQKKLLPGVYHVTTSPNLIPIGQTFDLKFSVAKEGTDVRLKGFVNGVEHLDVVDATPLANLEEGHGLIRLDFMEACFDDYRLSVPSGVTPPSESEDYRKGWNERGDHLIGLINSTRK